MISKVKSRGADEIDLVIHVGSFQFTTKVLKETPIGAVIDLIRNTKIH